MSNGRFNQHQMSPKRSDLPKNPKVGFQKFSPNQIFHFEGSNSLVLIQYIFTKDTQFDPCLVWESNQFSRHLLTDQIKKTSKIVKFFRFYASKELRKSSGNNVFTNLPTFDPLTKVRAKETPAVFTKEFGSSGFQGEVIYSYFFPNFVPAVQTRLAKVKFPEMHILTNSDLLTWNLSLYKQKQLLIRLGQFVRYGTEIIKGIGIPQSGQVLVFKKNELVLRRAQPFLLASGSYCRVSEGDFVATESPLLTLSYKTLNNDDIVQGIPKIDQLFEARETIQNGLSLNCLIKEKFSFYKKSYSKKDAVRKSVQYIQQYIIDGIQYVYQSQGVNISDKHIEIIVKQMTSKVKITNPGTCGLFAGEIVELELAESVNHNIDRSLSSKIKSQYEPIVFGITKASLGAEGFLSAASFSRNNKNFKSSCVFLQEGFFTWAQRKCYFRTFITSRNRF